MDPTTAAVLDQTRSLAEVLDAYGPWAVCAVLFIAFGILFVSIRHDYVSRMRHLEKELDNVNGWARELVTGARKRKQNGGGSNG